MERVFDVDIKAMFAPLLQSSDERVESEVSYPVETKASKISRERNEKAIQHEIDSLGTKTTQLGDRTETKRDSTDKSSKLILSREELTEHQKSDRSLTKTKVTENSQGDDSFFLKSGLIHRKCIDEDREINQLVFPKCCRQELLIMAQSIPMAGHLGVETTQEYTFFSSPHPFFCSPHPFFCSPHPFFCSLHPIFSLFRTSVHSVL